MFYVSTRDKNVRVASAEAITKGISADGGLFVPEEFPCVSISEIERIASLDYIGRAKALLRLYLTDFSDEEIASCAEGAYGNNHFSSPAVAPLIEIEPGMNILELWKGPTCAFKDMALQILPRLLTVAGNKTAKGTEIVILVATSGDTGKAALEGFRDVPNTKIIVFYPDRGVSAMQKLQMCTQEGSNVSVCAIEGNFDDAQNGVKKIFTDKRVGEILAANGMAFSSANSINWGRLVPQIVYYFSAYCDMLNNGSVKAGEKINIVVPTGNFGNILAAYYAKRMGLPVNKFICASNQNSVLTDFLTTGVYDRNRHFYTTISPSMDILISSNLERLLYAIGGCDKVSGWMKQLSESGRYEVDADVLASIKADFAAGCCDDEQTKTTIAKLFNEKSYLCDTHTGVAVKVFYDYCEKTGDKTPTVIASTASPYKFGAAVLGAVKGSTDGLNEFETVDELRKITGAECPAQIAELKGKPVRFTKCCTGNEMERAVLDFLGI